MLSQHRGGNRRRNIELKQIADETKTTLRTILAATPGLEASASSIHGLTTTAPIDPLHCPGYSLGSGDAEPGRKGTRIRVLNKDSFDAAIELDPGYTVHTHLDDASASPRGSSNPGSDSKSKPDGSSLKVDATCKPDSEGEVANKASIRDPENHDDRQTKSKAPVDRSDNRRTSSPVAVLNLASERSPGGGWQNGAMAQEEALCYRSSLYLSLHKSYYPIPSLSAIYSPNVLIIRDASSAGHALRCSDISSCPVTSVISIAALRHPSLTDDGRKFKNEGQRAETKRKIRLVLRLAASKGHKKLVLGALGCGVFSNPPKEIAKCFLEVFREPEFAGGWWEEIVFAVLDNAVDGQGGKDGVGNFGQFYRVLNGRVV
jgi:uncharacterized protein (TIGR02452 family)